MVGNALRAVDEAEDSGASESSDEAGTDASHDRGRRALLGSGVLLSEHGHVDVDTGENVFMPIKVSESSASVPKK